MGTLGNIQVEPCNVEWAGNDLGFTDGDIEIATEEQAVDITAHQEGTNVLDAIRTGKSAEVTLTLKETVLAKMQALLEAGGETQGGTAQVETIDTVADVSGSLNNKIMFVTGKHPTTKVVTTYVLWMNVNSAGTDPSIPGMTSVEIVLATAATANDVADAVASALDALPEFAAPNPGADVVTVTHSLAGAVASPDAGNSGFTVLVTVPGVSALTGWGKTKDFVGMLAQSDLLRLHPVARDNADLSRDLNFWKAYPMLNSVVHSGENPKTFAVTFKVFPDSTQPDEVRLFALGDGT